jgi:hypothetical protein
MDYGKTDCGIIQYNILIILYFVIPKRRDKNHKKKKLCAVYGKKRFAEI